MSDKNLPSGKQYVYSFSSGKLVLLVSMVLILMALSLMLGIRIERLQEGVESDEFERVKAPITLSAVSSPETNMGNDQLENAGNLQAPQPLTPATASAPVGVSEPSIIEKAAAAPPKAAPEPVQKAVSPKQEEPKTVTAAETAKPAVAPISQKQPVQQPASPASGQYAIQVSSSQDKAMAEHQVEQFKKKGLDSFIEEIVIEKKGRFYRVLLGPYATEVEATASLNKLKQDASFAGSYVRYLP